jgi:alcohol dehydrogenase
LHLGAGAVLSDILPTGFEVGVLNGNVRPGDVVAVVAVNSDTEDPLEAVRGLSDGLGADVAIEAVGIPRDLRALHQPGAARAAGSPTSASTSSGWCLGIRYSGCLTRRMPNGQDQGSGETH